MCNEHTRHQVQLNTHSLHTYCVLGPCRALAFPGESRLLRPGQDDVLLKAGLHQVWASPVSLPASSRPPKEGAPSHAQQVVRPPVGPDAGPTQRQAGSRARAARLPGGAQPHERYGAAAGTTSFTLRCRTETLQIPVGLHRPSKQDALFHVSQTLAPESNGRNKADVFNEISTRASSTQPSPAPLNPVLFSCHQAALVSSSGAPRRAVFWGDGREHTCVS